MEIAANIEIRSMLIDIMNSTTWIWFPNMALFSWYFRHTNRNHVN